MFSLFFNLINIVSILTTTHYRPLTTPLAQQQLHRMTSRPTSTASIANTESMEQLRPQSSATTFTSTSTERLRPLSEYDIAVLTLSDRATTSKRIARELQHGPDRIDSPIEEYSEYMPRPLFTSDSMIDRDMARLRAKQAADLKDVTINYSRPLAQSQGGEDGANSKSNPFRFVNSCDRIDAEPRTDKDMPGDFTDAEMSMFDPIFQEFIQNCNKYGIAGSGLTAEPKPYRYAPPSNSREFSWDDAHYDKPLPPLPVRSPRRLDKALQKQQALTNALSESYWDEEAQKKWLAGIANAEDGDAFSTQASPSTSSEPSAPGSTASTGYFTAFPKTRPSRAKAKTTTTLKSNHLMLSDLENPKALTDPAWWVSDEFLDEVTVKKVPKEKPTVARTINHPQAQAAELRDTERPYTADPSITTRNKQIPWWKKFPPSDTSSSADMSVKFRPLPEGLRNVGNYDETAEVRPDTRNGDEKQARGKDGAGLGGLVRTPSTWLRKRVASLSGRTKSQQEGQKLYSPAMYSFR